MPSANWTTLRDSGDTVSALPTVKVKYGSRSTKPYVRSSSPSTLSDSPPPVSRKRKRPLEDDTNTIISKRTILSQPGTKQRVKSKTACKEKQKTLTQLHFSLDTTVLRTCALCQLSYTKGAPDDESLHRAHCARVQRGMEWGKEEERECVKAGVEELPTEIRLKDGKKGRIVCFRANVGGKIGAKLAVLLETVNLALSSPPLTKSILADSKAYLFLLSSAVPSREKIVGCVIAQRIETAMDIVSDVRVVEGSTPSEEPSPKLIIVDPSTSLYCNPRPRPTPLGIPRLFVTSTHRRQGIASHLLTAAAENFVHGCRLDPKKGQVAFTQPTGLGGMVMKKWGGGGVRVYEE